MDDVVLCFTCVGGEHRCKGAFEIPIWPQHHPNLYCCVVMVWHGVSRDITPAKRMGAVFSLCCNDVESSNFCIGSVRVQDAKVVRVYISETIETSNWI